MKRIVFLLIFLLGFSRLYSQQSTSAAPVNPDSVYATVDKQPVFQFGDVYTWLGQHIVYPKSAVDSGIQGKIFVSFIVEKNGTVSTIKLLAGVDTALNREALRVVSQMPLWVPGRLNQEPVRVKLMLPIAFKLINPNLITEDYKVYCDTCVDKQPVFIYDLRTYLRNRMYWSREAARTHAQGSIVVGFIIEKDGNVSHIEIVSCDPTASMLQENALQVVDDMITVDKTPKWSPGYIKGKPVRVRKQVTLDYNFGLYHASSGH